MRIVCISDTHNKHNEMNIPDGDILIHSGDLSIDGTIKEIKNFNEWLGTLNHKYKIFIAGNHDFLFEGNPITAKNLITNAIYLENSGINIEGLNIWGSPDNLRFYDGAFNKEAGEDIKKVWDLIPNNTDILITHNPPYMILDKINSGKNIGCNELAKKILEIKPKLCIFGHVHDGYGIVKKDDITYINAASLNRNSEPTNEPIIFDI